MDGNKSGKKDSTKFVHTAAELKQVFKNGITSYPSISHAHYLHQVPSLNQPYNYDYTIKIMVDSVSAVPLHGPPIKLFHMSCHIVQSRLYSYEKYGGEAG